MKYTLVDRCLAKKAKYDLTGFFVFCRVGHAGADADLAADYAVAAVEFKFLREHMHRAAFAADAAAFFAVKFCQNGLRGNTLDDRLHVIAI